ncbi:1-like protein [Nannochloropsis gaditana CCMP526]|uniref:1-like protein n=1 Tax=Nannochloropsis gaditana (strain CCMP526) TaxID=1093141 RepID=UPI00029F647D|nr:1-like protein [Nannochloropsis gaditana CCMP526]EKU21092.1 1-like protein [Nannochloropsis gaditana CCMP526]|eukprot:XP_005855267.1 1-like protein [Nannochloropsis gaditana CCMP526]
MRGTYMDPETNIRYDTNNADFEVKSAELKAQKRNALEVSTPETTFLMYADTEKEKDDWIGAVGRAIVRSSTTYTQEVGEAGDEDDDGSDYED